MEATGKQGPGLPTRVQVRCVASATDEEERLVVPLSQAYVSRWTVADLLQRVRQRARRVPAADLEELELDCEAGGRLEESDLLEAVLQDGDQLRCGSFARAQALLRYGVEEAGGSVGRAAVEQPVPASAEADGGTGWRDVAKSEEITRSGNGHSELEEGYARVFGSAGVQEPGEEEEDEGEEEEEEDEVQSEESQTPPAPTVPPEQQSPPEPPAAAWARRPPPPPPAPSSAVGHRVTFADRVVGAAASGGGGSPAGGSAGGTSPGGSWCAREARPSPAGLAGADGGGARAAAVPSSRSRSPPLLSKAVQQPPSAAYESDAKWPPLLKAVYDGDLEVAKGLLQSNADVNCTMSGAGQKTPIYYAIRFEHADLVRYLLGHPEVDVHRHMRSGRGGQWTTPVEAAREAGPGTPVYQAFADAGYLPGSSRREGFPRPMGLRPAASRGLEAPQPPAYGGVPMAARRLMYGARK